MKLEIRNLGRIAEADLDLRPLTVFVGPNNTNQSWAAYAAWGGIGGSRAPCASVARGRG